MIPNIYRKLKGTWLQWSLTTEFSFAEPLCRFYLCRSIKNLCEELNKLKSRGFRASSLSTYDFSTLYTTLPHNLIKDKLVDLIERTFQRIGSFYIACNDRNAFFTSDAVRNYNLWSCQKVCEALTFLSDLVGWLVGFGFNGPLRQYFSLYRAVSQKEGERGKKG